ncbi:TPA: EcsC family protein [Enterobacter hormaechei]|nr:EcsC family protein [Enterobacter hormaechei]
MENNDEIDVEHDNEMPAEEHNPSSIQVMMGWLYDKAVSGIAGIESAETLAERYLADAKGDVTKAAHAMIRWESVKAGSTGFLSGVGGVVAMPVTLPLNITSVLFLQTRLVAAIACLGKRNLADERIRALTGLCLCGNAAKALLQEVALQAMENWTRPFTRRIVEKTLVLMAARAGMRTGGQFIRLVPLAGGVVSGAVDVTTTRTIGRIACTTYLSPYPGQRIS